MLCLLAAVSGRYLKPVDSCVNLQQVRWPASDDGYAVKCHSLTYVLACVLFDLACASALPLLLLQTVDELRKQRKEAAEATAAAEAAKENESADANGVEAAEDEDDDVPAGSSRAAASKGKKRKAAGAGAIWCRSNVFASQASASFVQ